MKAVYKFILAIALAPAVLFFLCVCLYIFLMIVDARQTADPDSPPRMRTTIQEKMDIDLSSGQKVTDHDSHGGFHGDGARYLVVSFPDDEQIKALSANPLWKKLPLPEAERKVFDRLKNFMDSYTENAVPLPKNGYYFVYDRHSKATNPQDAAGVLDEDRYSTNVSFAVFDTDENMLYYLELDT